MTPRAALFAAALALLPEAGRALDTSPESTPETSAATARRPALLPVPEPNLDLVDPVIRQQVTEINESILRNRSDSARNDAELAGLYGRLGKIHLLYHLHDAAEAALKNASALDPENVHWTYFLGMTYQESYRLPEAVAEFERVLAAKGGDPAVMTRLAQIDLSRGELDAAAARFSEALTADPLSAAARAGLGEVAAQRGDHAAAVRYLEEALQLQPKATRLHHALGLAYRGLGDLQKARQHLELRGEGVVSFPDPMFLELADVAKSASIYVADGIVAQGRGDYERAVEIFRLALEVDPENARARSSLIGALAELGDLEAALVEAEWMAERDPGSARARLNVGVVLASMRRVEDALPHLEAAVELADDFAGGHGKLGEAYQYLGKTELAERHLSRALELDPQALENRLRRGLVRAELGRYEAALDDLERVLEIDPKRADALLGTGRVLIAIGRPDEGLARVDAALAGELPDALRGTGHLEAGRVLLARGAADTAIGHLQAAAVALPGMAEPMLLLARGLGQQGRFAEAADAYGEAIRIDPDVGAAYFGRGLALMLAERYAEALAHLDESLERRPGRLDLKQALARLLAACPDDAVRNGDRALALARELLAAERTLEHGETLAMAMAETGDYEQAAQTQRAVLGHAQSTAESAALPRLRRRLALYEAGRPLRAPWLERG